MERIKLIILLLFLHIGFTAYSQYNINVDWFDCSRKNFAIFAQAVTEVIGKEKVTELLELNWGFSIDFEVDSLGYVMGINRISRKIPIQITDTIQGKIKDYLIKRKRRFYICYIIPYECLADSCKFYPGIVETLRQEKTNPHASGFFTYELFYHYYDRYLEKNPKDSLSIFEFFQKEIEKYLPEE